MKTALLAGGALFWMVSAQAQLTRGFLSGTLTDATGGAVADVQVRLTEAGTGIQHDSKTNEAGVYRFVGLEPGNYSVLYTRTGFDTVRVEDVALSTAQEVVINQIMPVAKAASEITVTASSAGAQLAKATPTLERTLSNQVLESLPAIGYREVVTLALLSPGMVKSTGQGTEAPDQFVGAGQRRAANGITLDGVDNRDSQWNYITLRSFPEGVAEMQVRTNSFSAEYGRNLGAQISIVTRSGTNQMHGQLWDFYGSNWLSSATLANKFAGLDKVRFNDHQAGGTFGGPILRNRTFFFGLLQAQPHREGISANQIPSIVIPTRESYDMLSRVPLGPGQTPEGRARVLSAISFLPDVYRQVRRFDTLRTVPVNGVPLVFGATRIGQSVPVDVWNIQFRLDHRLSDHDSLTYRYSYGSLASTPDTGFMFSNNEFGRRFAAPGFGSTQQHTGSHTHLFSPALVNELRISTLFGVNDIDTREDELPRTAVTTYFNLGPHPNAPFHRPRNNHEVQDILTWTRGRHSLKIGGHFLITQDTVSGPQQSVWTFTNFADFLNNQANTLAVRLGTSVLPMRPFRQNYFIQDDFRIRPELTLNIGVRYQTANTPEGLFGAATPEIAAAGVPAPMRPDRNDVAPRFGFAYSPRFHEGWRGRLFGKGLTVVRGGYGIAYSLLYEDTNGGTLFTLTGNYPWNSVRNLDRQQLGNVYPVTPATTSPNFNPLSAFTNFVTNGKNPTMHFYSLSVQRELRRNYIIELGYLGNRSYHLSLVNELNAPTMTAAQAQTVRSTLDPNQIPGAQQRRPHPEWGARTLNDAFGYSYYNGGYIKVDRRLASGLLIGANYTWSASLGLGDATARLTRRDNPRADYSRTPLDIPRRFVIHYVWQTPGNRFFSKWQVSGFSQWQSGPPFSILTGVDSNGDGNAGNDRPDLNPTGRLTPDPDTGNYRTFSAPINGTGRFVTPLNRAGTPLQFSMPFGGNLGRNTMRGAAYAQWNLSIMKPFRVTERLRLEVRADANNLLNHRNFGTPDNRMNSVTFGRNLTNPPNRALLLGAKIRF